MGDGAAKKEIILRGAGWGGLPEHYVAKELESGQLVALSIDEFETRLWLKLVGQRQK